MPDQVIDLEQFQKKLTPRRIGLLALVLLVIIAAFSSFYIVDQKEEAVVLFLGKYTRTAGPGLHFKLPFGIEKNFNVPTQRVLKEEFGFRAEQPGVTTTYSSRDYTSESEMLTGDLNILDVRWIIQYRIKDPRQWLFNVENQRKTIRDLSQSVINLLVGDRTIFDVIGNERANIEVKGQEMMNRYFDLYELGARVTTVKLQNIVPPKGTVQDAFEDVNKAIQDRSRLINEGKETYNKTIPRARGEAEQVIQEAEGYAIERVNLAQGDVARFLAVYEEYRKNPRITRMRLYFETFEEIFKKVGDTDIIDKRLGNFLPFKNIEKAASKGGDQ
ncbi:MAG TPA: FtsH protease activity modulator HflK [Candidatus Aminicenantes bacterium]|nr:FtsH protease activity modulator HflK [Candidatus Aminicenantes bacterium]